VFDSNSPYQGKDGIGEPAKDRFATLDSRALTTLMLNTELTPDNQREVIAAFSRLNPSDRGNSLVGVLRTMFSRMGQYSEDYMMSMIDLLATDPASTATAAMISLLPNIAEGAFAGREGISEEFREYYYEALVTRRRDGDREVWRRLTPKLDDETILMIIKDPAAEPLRKFVNPLKLIDRMPEPRRSRLLRAAVVRTGAKDGWEALMTLMKKK